MKKRWWESVSQHVLILAISDDSVTNKNMLSFLSRAYVSPLLWLYTHKSEVGFGDGAVLKAAVGPTSCCLVEGDTKSPAGGEVQLMTKPEGDRDNETITQDHFWGIFRSSLVWPWPEPVVGAGVCKLGEAMLELRLHCQLLVPHLAVNADVPVLVHDDEVIALVQHTQLLQGGRLCGHRVRRCSPTHIRLIRQHTCLYLY